MDISIIHLSLIDPNSLYLGVTMVWVIFSCHPIRPETIIDVCFLLPNPTRNAYDLKRKPDVATELSRNTYSS